MVDAPLYFLVITVISVLGWAVYRLLQRDSARDEENHDTQVPEEADEVGRVRPRSGGGPGAPGKPK